MTNIFDTIEQIDYDMIYRDDDFDYRIPNFRAYVMAFYKVR